MKRHIVLLGPPGSGKGTLARMLEERLGFDHLSTGQWFRREAAEETPLGKRVSAYVERGELVPDDVVIELMEHWFTPDLRERGYLLDGFPRTLRQAEAFERFCTDKQVPLDAVLYLDCPEPVIIERLSSRRVCANCGKNYHVRNSPPRISGVCDICGGPVVQRADDREDVVKNRLDFYREITEPLVEHYRKCGRLVSLNGVVGSEEAYVSAAEVLAS